MKVCNSKYKAAPSPPARNCLCVALATVLMVLGAPAGAQQAGAAQEYSIQAASLDDALKQLAKQSKLQIVYSPDLVKGKQAGALSGPYTWQTALQRLLSGTGLEWKLINNSTVVLTKGTAPQQPSAPPTTRVPAKPSPAEAPVNMAEVLVRGSQSLNADIQRSPDDAQPYVVFNRVDLERSGAVNINDFLLKRVTANTTTATPSQRAEIGGDHTSINLRGLGEGQTLILVDGRRLAAQSFGTLSGQPNINGIPLGAVERIEVLPSTASAIYGGSATGGVINIVLRRGYEGGEVSLSHDNSFDTDSSISRVDFTYGKSLANGKTSIMVNGSLTESNLLLNRDRDFVKRAVDRIRANSPGYLGSIAVYGTSPNIRSANGSNLVLDNGTPLNARVTYVPQGYLGPSSDGAAALLANAGQLNTEPTLAGGYSGGGGPISTGPRTKSIAASVRHSFTDNLDGFLDVSHTNTYAREMGGVTTQLTLGANDPRNPFQQPIAVTFAPYQYNALSERRNRMDRVSTGLIARLPKDWAGSVDFTWSRASVEYVTRPGLIDAGPLLASGFNPLIDHVGLGTLNLGALAPVPVASRSIPVTSYSFNPTVRLGGPLWELPAGAVTGSFLLEQQKIKFTDGAWRQNQGSPSEVALLFPPRSQDVRSVYAEFGIPLFSEKNARTGLRALELQLALRHDDYRSVSGSWVTWFPGQTSAPAPFAMAENSASETTGLVGLKYSPVNGLIFRASHGTGFVPPDMTQLGAPSRNDTWLSTTPDPRRGNTTATVPMVQLFGSNPNLEPEDSETTSVGVIFEPTFLEGFRASLDYTLLKKTNIITILSEAQLLQFESMFPDRVQRGAPLPTDPAGWAGPITFMDTSRVNAASARQEALDLQVKYGLDLDNGARLEFWGNGTWRLTSETQLLPGLPIIPSDNNFRGFYGVDYEKGGWGLGWTVRHYGSYPVANRALVSSATVLAAQGNNGRVPRQLLHDFSFRWRSGSYSDENAWRRILSNTEISGGIRNVFNKEPEVDINSPGLYSTAGDARLRTYYVQMTYRF